MAKRTTKTAAANTDDKAISVGALAQMFRAGLDMDGAAPVRPSRPYAQSEWVYICVNAVIKACTSIQMQISTEAEDIIEDGPAVDVLYNNPDLTFSQFIKETAGFLALFEQCYWVFTERVGLRPTKLMVVGPGQLKPEIRNGQLLYYRYYPVGGTMQTLLIDDVWPLLGFNPDDRFIAVGPSEAGKIAISTAHQAALFNEASMANGGKLSGLITLPAGIKLDDDEKNFLMAQFEARHKGAKNAGKWALMTGGADVKPLSQTMADLEMLSLRQFDAKTICSLFGVPPEVVGLATEAQYSHGPAQQRFILNTIASLLSFIAENITMGILRPWRYQKEDHKSAAPVQSKRWLSSRKRLKQLGSWRNAAIKAVSTQAQMFAWFVVEEHPTVKEMLQEQAGKVLEYTKAGIVLNDIIDSYDLPFEKRPHGDHWWTGMGTVPADYILEGGLEAITGPQRPEGQEDIEPEPKKVVTKGALDPVDEKAANDKRTRIWRKWVASWLPIEKEYEEALRGLFRKQQDELLTKLKSAMGETKSVKADAGQVVARVVFDLIEQNGKLKLINQIFYEKASRLGTAQTLSETSGLSGDALQEAVNRTQMSAPMRRALEVSRTKITKVNANTQKWVSSQIREGLEKGEGLTELTNRLTQNKAFGRGRAGTIARTQTSGAVSSGRMAGMKEAGVEKKSWLTARDGEVRQAHRDAERDYADGIPINQAFVVGGERLQYPCDPEGSAAMIANCRCLQLAVILASGKVLDLAYYDNVKFVTWFEIKIWAEKAA